MKNKILITGAGGFVGKNLVKSLKEDQKHDLVLVVRKSGFGADYFMGDLMDYEKVKDFFKGVEVVIHMATSKYYPNNKIITKNVIDASKENKVKKIIFVSSMSAKRQHPDEYGRSKIVCEKMVKESGLTYTLLRPSLIYGKGSVSFNFMLKKMKKIPFVTPIIGSGRYKMAPISIHDVVHAIKKCVDNDKTNNKEYDLVGGETVYFINLVNELKKELHDNKKNLCMPLWFCYSVAAFFPQVIKKENIRNFAEDSIPDVHGVKEDLELQPIKFSARKDVLI